jgi:hypothetical protein
VQLVQFLHGLRSTAAVFDDNDYAEPSVCGGVNCRDYRYDVTMSATARAFVDLDRPFDDVEGEPARATDVTDLFGFVPGIDDAFLQGLLGQDEAGVDAAFQSVGVLLDPTSVSGIARSDLYVHNVDITTLHSNDAPIGAGSAAPPFGWEIGRYGVQGVDSHAVGKPSTGVHLSVESGTLNGTEAYGPDAKWVGGAEAFALGDLNPGQTVTFDVLLSVYTVQNVVSKPAGIALRGAARASERAAGPLKAWRPGESRRAR